ncbi:hypothetical protein B0H21DRAFT_469645 [Amylocystis lapponica]|nr:hypothetical protein B0H21DRAFT_469645 [Amylocystis lapponica]
MNVTTTILHPTPPPTTNTLDARQRVRLIRSARKLGSVLGATPQLIEPQPSPPEVPIARLPFGPSSRPGTPKSLLSHRRGSPAPSASPTPSLYASSANSSVASLVLPTPHGSCESLPEPRGYSSKPRRSKELPRPLVLRLNAVPVSHSDPRVRVQPPSPSTATSVTTPTPFTPTTPVPPSSAEARRRRMAKLQRTLGENVPHDLVFPAPTPASAPSTLSVPALGHHGRSPSLDDDLPPARSSRVWVTGSSAWTGEWNRRDIREVQQQLRALRA